MLQLPSATPRRRPRAELQALEPRLPYLTITVSGDGAVDAVVTMDGKPVPNALVGVPAPVDPGEHELQATGNEVQSAVAKVSLAEGARDSVALELVSAPGVMPPGAAAGIDPRGTGPGEQPPVTPDTPPPTQDQGGGGMSGMRIGSYVALGVGVVGLGAGTFFALRASGKYSDADALCTDARLPGR